VRRRRVTLLFDGAAVGRWDSRSGGDEIGVGARHLGRVQRAHSSAEVWRLPHVMSYRLLSIHREGAVERVTLNRPEVRNAFDEHMIEELTRWAGAAAADATLRVVVF